MTQGFYEQLGVEPDASAGQVRSAWAGAVARIGKRRKAALEQGGETGPLDLARTRLDEALAVLGDPLRRRRYDALLRWVASPPVGADGAPRRDAETLWGEVGDALVSPAVAAAVRLLRTTTRLDLGAVATAASAGEDPPTLIPADEDLTAPRAGARRIGPSEPQAEPRGAAPRKPMARVVPMPGVPSVGPAPSGTPQLLVVDGQAAPVVVMPVEPKKVAVRVEKAISAEDVARLVDRHGFGGALLRAAREARGQTLQDVSATTRISVRYLEAIESDAFEQLPSSTFVRGYVREISRLLKLDEAAVVQGYMRRLAD